MGVATLGGALAVNRNLNWPGDGTWSYYVTSSYSSAVGVAIGPDGTRAMVNVHAATGGQKWNTATLKLFSAAGSWLTGDIDVFTPRDVNLDLGAGAGFAKGQLSDGSNVVMFIGRGAVSTDKVVYVRAAKISSTGVSLGSTIAVLNLPNYADPNVNTFCAVTNPANNHVYLSISSGILVNGYYQTYYFDIDMTTGTWTRFQLSFSGYGHHVHPYSIDFDGAHVYLQMSVYTTAGVFAKAFVLKMVPSTAAIVWNTQIGTYYAGNMIAYDTVARTIHVAGTDTTNRKLMAGSINSDTGAFSGMTQIYDGGTYNFGAQAYAIAPDHNDRGFHWCVMQYSSNYYSRPLYLYVNMAGTPSATVNYARDATFRATSYFVWSSAATISSIPSALALHFATGNSTPSVYWDFVANGTVPDSVPGDQVQAKPMSSMTLDPSSVSVTANQTLDLSAIKCNVLYTDGTVKVTTPTSWTKNGSTITSPYNVGGTTGAQTLVGTFTEYGNSVSASLAVMVTNTLSSLTADNSTISGYASTQVVLSQLAGIRAVYSGGSTTYVTPTRWIIKNVEYPDIVTLRSTPGNYLATAYYTQSGTTVSTTITITVLARPVQVMVTTSEASMSTDATIDLATTYGPFYLKNSDGTRTSVSASELEFTVLNGGGTIA